MGIAFDKFGRLLVIESHTHKRPKNYKGPEKDRILIFEIKKGGKLKKLGVFIDNLQQALQLLIHRDGSLYIAHRNYIDRVWDQDGDGKADKVDRVVTLDTKCKSWHSGLSGMTFSRDGREFRFELAENLGEAYILKGSDGKEFRGGGEGGNTYVANPDGSKMTLETTGNWNFYGMCTDFFGNVFAVDNDSNRPPCRLVHIIPGGDYGYQYRYGRGGTHLFQAWNGELPGTLPMVSETGEAPCGVLHYEGNNLPDEYRGDLLVGGWGSHEVERYKLRPRGASFSAERIPFIKGGLEFRPINIAIAPDGSLYVTDWVKKTYSVHGYGRIWRISAREKKAPALIPDLRTENDMHRARKTLYAESQDTKILEALGSSDPFVVASASYRLSRKPTLLKKTKLKDLKPEARIGFLKALEFNGSKNSRKRAGEFLGVSDEAVKIEALRWISGEKLTKNRKAVERILKSENMSPKLAEACLTTIFSLDGKKFNKKFEVKYRDAMYFNIIKQDTSSALSRAALKSISFQEKKLTIDFLRGQIKKKFLRATALAKLILHPDPRKFPVLRDLYNSKLDTETKIDLISSFYSAPAEHSDFLFSTMRRGTREERYEALRVADPELFKAEIKKKAIPMSDTYGKKLVARIQGEMPKFPPIDNLNAWIKHVPAKGNISSGNRLFFNKRLLVCGQCHSINRRGGMTGPDLTRYGQSKSRKEILEAILFPSRHMSPSYTAWMIEFKDGRTESLVFRNLGNKETEIFSDVAGKIRQIKTEDIHKRTPLDTSLMPPGQIQHLTKEELGDLFAFLEATR